MLEESLEMTPENVSAFLNGEIPDYISRHVARDLGFSEDDISKFSPEEVFNECIGKSYFLDIALSYVSNHVMKRMKNGGYDCMPCEAIDAYALQLAENGIRNGFATMGMRITKSKKSPFMWMVDIPNRKEVENAATNNSVKPLHASNIIKVGLGNNGKMKPETVDFAVNTIPIVKGNLRRYKESVMPDVYREFMFDLNHSAEIIGVDL